MKDYRCSWVIDIAARSPSEAAAIAEKLMAQRQQSTWTVAWLASSVDIDVKVAKGGK